MYNLHPFSASSGKMCSTKMRDEEGATNPEWGSRENSSKRDRNETDQWMDGFYHVAGCFIFCQKVLSRMKDMYTEKEAIRKENSHKEQVFAA